MHHTIGALDMITMAQRNSHGITHNPINISTYPSAANGTVLAPLFVKKMCALSFASLSL